MFSVRSVSDVALDHRDPRIRAETPAKPTPEQRRRDLAAKYPAAPSTNAVLPLARRLPALNLRYDLAIQHNQPATGAGSHGDADAQHLLRPCRLQQSSPFIFFLPHARALHQHRVREHAAGISHRHERLDASGQDALSRGYPWKASKTRPRAFIGMLDGKNCGNCSGRLSLRQGKAKAIARRIANPHPVPL